VVDGTLQAKIGETGEMPHNLNPVGYAKRFISPTNRIPSRSFSRFQILFHRKGGPEDVMYLEKPIIFTTIRIFYGQPVYF
jgi:hypothetical protein